MSDFFNMFFSEWSLIHILLPFSLTFSFYQPYNFIPALFFYYGEIVTEALLAFGTSAMSLSCSSVCTANWLQCLWRTLGSCVGCFYQNFRLVAEVRRLSFWNRGPRIKVYMCCSCRFLAIETTFRIVPLWEMALDGGHVW